MQAGSNERPSSPSCCGTPGCLTMPCGCWWPQGIPALQQGWGRVKGHKCCCPGESKAGAGAVSLVLFSCCSPFFVSLGCAGAWRNIYRGGQSMRKYLILYQRSHGETWDSLCPQHSSVSELHILQEQPRHSRCSSSMILPGGQMLLRGAVSAAPLRHMQDFTVPACQELILFAAPHPDS